MQNETIRDSEDSESKVLMYRNTSVRVAITAITAALYIALGSIFQAIGFLGLQFRVAELMVGMCILFPLEGLIGKVIGVFFVNLFSPLGPIELISCIVNIPALYCIILLREKKHLKYLGGVLYSIIISIYVAIILDLVFPGQVIWLNFVQILIAEVILASLGILLFDLIKQRVKF